MNIFKGFLLLFIMVEIMPNSFKVVRLSSIVNKKREELRKYNGFIVEVNESNNPDRYIAGRLKTDKNDNEYYRLIIEDTKGKREMKFQYRNLQNLLVKDESIFKDMPDSLLSFINPSFVNYLWKKLRDTS